MRDRPGHCSLHWLPELCVPPKPWRSESWQETEHQSSQMVANPPGIQVKRLPFVVEKERCISPGDSTGKESTCNVGHLGLIPGLGRSPGEGNRNPLQYSGLENSVDWRIPWVRKEPDTTERLTLFTFSESAAEPTFLLQGMHWFPPAGPKVNWTGSMRSSSSRAWCLTPRGLADACASH